jgi:hypothetical protein
MNGCLFDIKLLLLLLLNITPRYLYSVHDSSWFGPK